MDLAKEVFEALKAQNLKLATAESCTGGMISAAITDIPGSSSVLDRGFVTYSNDAKMDMLNVSRGTLEEHGAVSAECAIQMANGALNNSLADIAVSVTGIAGPDGGNNEKPVGLVYFGLAQKGLETESFKEIFDGDRSEIRIQARDYALKLLMR